MRIDFVFDTICPWCYVGKRRLERALAERPGARADIRWRPFLLNPDLPDEGIPRELYLERKFGGPARINRVQSAVLAAGRGEGIDFAFDRIRRTPNSVNSHRLVRFAAHQGQDGPAVEALYRAYFREGRDIGRMDELLDIGAAVGLDRAELARYLDSDADVAAVTSENARAHRLGVNGVPCIIFEGSYALAGAQEPDVLLRIIDIARENQPEAALS